MILRQEPPTSTRKEDAREQMTSDKRQIKTAAGNVQRYFIMLPSGGKEKKINQTSQYSRRPSLFVDKISQACFFKRAIFGGDEMRENRSGRL